MEIFPRLFLGNKHDASNPHFLNSNSIYFVLNVTDDIKNHFENINSVPFRKEMEERGLKRINELVDEDSLEVLSQRSLNESSLSQQEGSTLCDESFQETNKSHQSLVGDTVLEHDFMDDILPSVKADILKSYTIRDSSYSPNASQMEKSGEIPSQQSGISSYLAREEESDPEGVESKQNANTDNPSNDRSSNEAVDCNIVSDDNLLGKDVKSGPQSSQESPSLSEDLFQASVPHFVDTQPECRTFEEFLHVDEKTKLGALHEGGKGSHQLAAPENILRLSFVQGRRTDISSSVQHNIQTDMAELEPVFLTEVHPPVPKHQLTSLHLPRKIESSTPKKIQQHEIITINFSQPITYKRIPIKDSHDENIFKHLDEAVLFIHEALQSNQNSPNSTGCLVHCREGKSRSVTCLLAYAMKILGKSLQQAYNYLVEISNNHIRINDGFKRQLMSYEKHVFGIETNSLDFFPKNRNKRARDYVDLYDSSGTEEDEPGTKRRRVQDYDDEDLLWSPDLEKRLRRKEYGIVKFLDVDHEFVSTDGKKQMTLFDMFKKKKSIEKTPSSESNVASKVESVPPKDDKESIFNNAGQPKETNSKNVTQAKVDTMEIEEEIPYDLPEELNKTTETLKRDSTISVNNVSISEKTEPEKEAASTPSATVSASLSSNTTQKNPPPAHISLSNASLASTSQGKGSLTTNKQAYKLKSKLAKEPMKQPTLSSFFQKIKSRKI